MIGVCDFVKLFCIINAKNYEKPEDCYDAACEYARILKSEFGSNEQVNLNDFLVLLNGIKERL